MTYNLTFLEDAFKEWKKLSPFIQQQFKKKLEERLANPCIPSALLHGMPDCYKIKLKSLGYRLVYQVYKDRLIVQVVAVGKRDKNLVYKKALQRL
jgi:mRNA interferase RelE/StbE